MRRNSCSGRGEGETPHKVGMHYVEKNRERAFALNLLILCLGFSCALLFCVGHMYLGSQPFL